MKKIIALYFLMAAVAINTMAQMPVNEKTGKFLYQEVVNADGSQQEFFNRAVTWVNNNYKNAADVTSVRDPHSGIVEGKHRIKLTYNNEQGVETQGEMILYHFKLQFKEGRYRYTFDDFYVRKQSRFPLEKWTDKESPDYLADNAIVQKQIDERISKLIESLKETMAPPVVEEEEEW